MKKQLLLLLPLLTGCSKTYQPKTYQFSVELYCIAEMCSEPKEMSGPMRIACCKSGVNYAAIEVPYDYNYTYAILIHTGYNIEYTVFVEGETYTVSNAGWELYEK